jgi:hypothetical protein
VMVGPVFSFQAENRASELSSTLDFTRYLSCM